MSLKTAVQTTMDTDKHRYRVEYVDGIGLKKHTPSAALGSMPQGPINLCSSVVLLFFNFGI